MNWNKKLAYFTLAGMCLILFVVRYHALDLPYFWDELGVYSKAVLYLFDHNISMLPGSIDPELSRGHPLLFAFIFAAWMKIFGSTTFAVHLLALLISMALLITTYWLGKTIGNIQIGLLASLLLLVQPLFLGQATMVLPETLLALFMTLSLIGYIQKKTWIYVVFSVASILTKETAITLPITLLLYEFCFKTNHIKKVHIIAPFIAFATFLLVQKLQNGWFLFPYHQELMQFHPLDVLIKLKEVLYFNFLMQGRIFYTLLAVILFLLYFKKFITKNIWLLIFFLFFCLSFDSVNFYIGRYSMRIFPVCLVLISSLIWHIKKTPIILFTTLLLIAISSNYWKGNHFADATDLSYENVVDTQKKITKSLEKHIRNNKTIAGTFPVSYGSEDIRQGYCQFPFEISEFNDSVDIVVVNSYGRKHENLNLTNFKPIEMIGDSIFSAQIFEKTNRE